MLARVRVCDVCVCVCARSLRGERKIYNKTIFLLRYCGFCMISSRRTNEARVHSNL